MEEQAKKLLETINNAIVAGVEKLPDMAAYVLGDIKMYFLMQGAMGLILSLPFVIVSVYFLKQAIKQRDGGDGEIETAWTMVSILAFIGFVIFFGGALFDFSKSVAPLGYLLTK